MTPTPEQLAAVLPRCSAGLDGGDWTDDDERLAWAAKVMPWVEEALRATESDETGREVAQPLLKPSRATQGPIRTYAAVIPYEPIRLTKSNDWPAPRKGTHESECGVEDSPGCLPHGNPLHLDCPGGFDEYNAGIDYWSRTPDTEEAK